MAITIAYFMLPEDEVAFLRALEPLEFDVYPEASEVGYEPFRAAAENADRFTEEAYYLAVPAAGEMVARKILRGKHKGMLELDEVRSPVIHYARSLPDEDGELRSGRVWAELETAGDRQHVMRKPDLLRALMDNIRTYFKKHHRHSKPVGYFVGPHAARRANEGLVLREAGRKGELIVPFK